MKVILAEHFGMCFGVRDAIAEAERLASAGPLTILGELVHNPIVRERLAHRGVREGNLNDEAATAQVMITAHGASDATRSKWRDAGYVVADGTCALVRHAHRQLRALVAASYFPIVIGQPDHVEVRGLMGDFPEARVLQSAPAIEQLPAAARFGVISQTTQPIEHVHSLVSALRRARPRSEVRFVDTVCKPTKDRQRALQKLLALADTIVVVGGRSSNNTKQLVAAAEAAQRRAIHVERADELHRAEFSTARVVGVTAGTSTLRETVAEVAACLHEIAAEIFAEQNRTNTQ